LKRVKIIFLAVGCVLLLLLFYSYGVKETVARIMEMGWNFWIIVAIGLFNNIFLTLGWRLIFNHKFKRGGFLKLLLARIAGDSTTSINAAGALAGEPIKALYLKDMIPFKVALASVVIDRTVHTIASILAIISGMILSFFFLKIPTVINMAMVAIFAATIWGILKILKKQKEGLIEYILNKLPQKIVGSFMNEKRWEKVRTLDQEIGYIFKDKNTMKRFYWALSVKYFSLILAGMFEIYFILKYIGSPVLVSDSLFIYVFGLFLTSVMFFIPANLGTSESAYSLALKFLGYNPALGLSVGIIRRLRSFVWSGIGILILLHAGLLKKDKKKPETN
jgi:hypothetical protein